MVAGDEPGLYLRKGGVARLRRLWSPAFLNLGHALAQRSRNSVPELRALERRPDLAGGAGIRSTRSRGDRRKVVADDVGDHEYSDWRRGQRRGETPCAPSGEAL